jgi:glycosyltransferase involved in cell wall biosynthesis
MYRGLDGTRPAGNGRMTAEVAFDLRAAGGSPTGAGRYLLSIVRALAEHRPDLPVRAYVQDEAPNLPAGVRVVRITSRGILWHARTWWHLRGHPARAYCSTSLILPALSGLPCLPVILDVISFLFPEHHTLRTRVAERLFMKRAVRRHPVIALSDTTGRDLERLFGPCRAAVVPPWVPPGSPAAEGARVIERLGIRIPYVLCVGTIEPRKNVLTALRAVAALRRGGSNLALVLIGGRGWIDKRVAAELEAAKSDGTAIVTGYLPDAERDAVFGSASCLVLPSVYEGFGLPLLEAMERGLPCVGSTAPVFEEVAGDAALRLEPFDVAAWSAAIEKVVTDRSFAERLARAGRLRARCYSSEATAAAFEAALGLLP